MPRSETQAIQSLLGHGFAVIPRSFVIERRIVRAARARIDDRPVPGPDAEERMTKRHQQRRAVLHEPPAPAPLRIAGNVAHRIEIRIASVPVQRVRKRPATTRRRRPRARPRPLAVSRFRDRAAAARTMSIATISTSITAANASHAARDRVSTSAATTSAIAIAHRKYVPRRAARKVQRSSSGNPNAATCATKLRLPSVPPGARFTEKKSISQSVRLQQRRRRRDDDRHRQRAEERAGKAGVAQRARDPEEQDARRAHRQRAQRQPAIRGQQRRQRAQRRGSRPATDRRA